MRWRGLSSLVPGPGSPGSFPASFRRVSFGSARHVPRRLGRFSFRPSGASLSRVPASARLAALRLASVLSAPPGGGCVSLSNRLPGRASVLPARCFGRAAQCPQAWGHYRGLACVSRSGRSPVVPALRLAIGCRQTCRRVVGLVVCRSLSVVCPLFVASAAGAAAFRSRGGCAGMTGALSSNGRACCSRCAFRLWLCGRSGCSRCVFRSPPWG